jgi:hypothetical protein
LLFGAVRPRTGHGEVPRGVPGLKPSVSPSSLWNLPATGYFEDSPGVALTWDPEDGGGANWDEHSASDSFECWAMFRPPSNGGQPTEWIPMLKITWKWAGKVVKQNGQWVLVPTISKSGIIVTPFEVFEHPQWTTFSPSPFFLTGNLP